LKVSSAFKLFCVFFKVDVLKIKLFPLFEILASLFLLLLKLKVETKVKEEKEKLKKDFKKSE
jgi:hypothetical protein